MPMKISFFIISLLAVLMLIQIVPLHCVAAETEAAENQEEVKETGRASALEALGEEPPMIQVPGTSGSFWRIRYQKVIMSWVVIAILVVFAIKSTKKFRSPPTRLQNLAEMVLGFFDQLTGDTLGEKSRKLFPLIATLFLFIVLCNWIGLIPGIVQFFGYIIGSIAAPFSKSISIEGGFLKWYLDAPAGHWLEIFNIVPNFSNHNYAEPTADLNTPLACGLIVIFVVHSWAIKYKGIKSYLKSYAEPIWLFAPLNVVGELAKGISLSFRLFGNILGGSIVILVLTELLYKFPAVFFPVWVAVPIVLQLFLGLFVGAIQAFVFSMLALTYTAVAIGDD
jgi:F-type H+-transporting ATPase subunit a